MGHLEKLPFAGEANSETIVRGTKLITGRTTADGDRAFQTVVCGGDGKVLFASTPDRALDNHKVLSESLRMLGNGAVFASAVEQVRCAQ